jgi:hypothetical protein
MYSAAASSDPLSVDGASLLAIRMKKKSKYFWKLTKNNYLCSAKQIKNKSYGN